MSAVERDLAAYGAELDACGDAQVGASFTDDPAADAFLKSSPAAFLIGVLFTQGIPAERAWAGPARLRERLGHFDLARLAIERDAVAEAVARRPALHRFTHTIAGWVSDAAALLLERYDGDAARIWADGSSATEVAERLSAFPGIGRKKAAMSVMILTRFFGVRLTGTERCEPAFDVHVRRVFLRTGMVDTDDPDAVADASRRVCPGDPGSLDLAAWLVGRTWCRPRQPACHECRLGEGCPRMTWLDAPGVGVRAKRR